MIDLRSDTLTKPSPEMLAAMVAAQVGDDVYGEDPSVQELEGLIADFFGKEAGLFCATGSLSNLLGVWLHTKVGTEVLCDVSAHIARAEMGAHGALHGVTMRTWPSNNGKLKAAEALALLAIDCGPYLVETACVAVEDTHNFGGGTVQDFAELSKLSAGVRAAGIKLHLDGARLANAMAVNGRTGIEYGELFDTISFCLSKGLGAPVGSVLVGTSDEIARARVQRKRLGGGWRQAGVLAAAGQYAFENNLTRVAQDHLAARELGLTINAECPGTVDLEAIESNIVLIPTRNATGIVSELQQAGVQVSQLGPSMLRAVTHLDVSTAECGEAGRLIGSVLARHAL